MNAKVILFNLLVLAFSFAYCHPEIGKWSFEATQPLPKTVVVTKSMYAKGTIDVNIFCTDEVVVTYNWVLKKTPCWKDHIESEPVGSIHVNQIVSNLDEIKPNVNDSFYISQKGQVHCDPKGSYLKFRENNSRDNLGLSVQTVNPGPDANVGIDEKDNAKNAHNSLYVMPVDGIYIYILEISLFPFQKFNSTINIHIEMKSSYGYLSAADYPLLPFYGVMCAVYICYAIGWLVVSFMRWREMLRVQYWIGAVILIGMLEKAVFTGVYETVNKTGDYDAPLLYFAEIISCFKRTLSRILVIIVAFGFGIVKPRLGNVLRRMLALGVLYFLLATIESFLRVTKVDNVRSTLSQKDTMALVPLAILETVICWWVFSALVNTILTLSLRRNSVKLQLYRHFKNTLIFCVVVSIIFMIYCIFYQNLNTCVRDWKQLWVNTAFWHVLFAFILLVIMTLWRPTINNQRFAFSPLLDSASEDEEENLVAADVSDTMKFRQTRSNSLSNSKDSHALEEDLQWLDENIPTTMIDKGFPSVDSDEEVIVTKFEISKMQ